MDDAKREELEKACKKEKSHKVRTRMVAVRMVRMVRMARVRNMSVEETASIQARCPTWVRNRLRHYDDRGLEGLRNLLCTWTPWKNVGTRESVSCLSQRHSEICTEPFRRIIGSSGSSLTFSNLPAENMRCCARTFDRQHSILINDSDN